MEKAATFVGGPGRRGVGVGTGRGGGGGVAGIPAAESPWRGGQNIGGRGRLGYRQAGRRPGASHGRRGGFGLPRSVGATAPPPLELSSC